MHHLYYNNTLQVRFYWNGEWCYGIAYHDTIIDGRFGEVFSTSEIIKAAAANGIGYDDAIIERVWADLTGTIRNVDFSENFLYNDYRKDKEKQKGVRVTNINR